MQKTANSAVQIYTIRKQMLINILTVGIGGFLGAISRYLIILLNDKFYNNYNFPFDTLFVNVLGSFLIGIALALGVKYDILSRHTLGSFLLVTGFLGSFTTFSAFSRDTLILFMEKYYTTAVMNILLNVILSIGMVIVGYFLIIKKF